MTLPRSIELELAIECCAPAAPDRMSKAARLAEKVDWTRFLAICRRHRIQGVVWRAIERFGLSPPEHVANLLAADAVEIATHGLNAASISAQLLQVFRAAGIPILFVKGLTLSKLAYGDPFVKMSHDIDVLVPGEDVERAGTCFAEMNYALAQPRHQNLAVWHRVYKESVWTRRGCPTIELHTRLANNHRLIPGICNRSPVDQVEIAPGINLPTLARDELIAYLCVHGASSAWFRLKWIADLAALLARSDSDEIDRLVDRASQLGAGRAFPAALLLAQQLFGLVYGPATQRAIATPISRWLARVAYRKLLDEAEPTQRRFGTASIHASQMFLMAGAMFKASELVHQIRTVRASRS